MRVANLVFHKCKPCKAFAFICHGYQIMEASKGREWWRHYVVPWDTEPGVCDLIWHLAFIPPIHTEICTCHIYQPPCGENNEWDCFSMVHCHSLVLISAKANVSQITNCMRWVSHTHCSDLRVRVRKNTRLALERLCKELRNEPTQMNREHDSAGP